MSEPAEKAVLGAIDALKNDALTQIKKISDEHVELTKSVNEMREKAESFPASEIEAGLQKLSEDIGKKEADWKAALARVEALEKRAEEAEIKRNSPKMPAGDEEEKKQRHILFKEYLTTGREPVSEIKVLRTDVDIDGGYQCSPEMDSELIRTITEFDPMRRLARVTSTTKKEVHIRTRVTGVTAGWEHEFPSLTEADGPTFGKEVIPTHMIMALSLATNNQLEDSDFDVSQMVTEEHGEEFGEQEAVAFITGSGVGKPEGIMTRAGISEVTSGDANLLNNGDKIWDLYYTPKTTYASQGTWIAQRQTFGKIRIMKDSTGNYLWSPGFESSPPTICGRPYEESPTMATIAANAYPLAFGDWRRAYRIIDRTGFTIQRLLEQYATQNAVGFLGRKRVGGAVVQPEAYAKMKIATP